MVQEVSALFQGEAVGPELVMETGLQSSVSADGVATLGLRVLVHILLSPHLPQELGFLQWPMQDQTPMAASSS